MKKETTTFMLRRIAESGLSASVCEEQQIASNHTDPFTFKLIHDSRVQTPDESPCDLQTGEEKEKRKR